MSKKMVGLVLLGLVACGGPDESADTGTHIAFKVHELQCEVPGMLARLEVTGIDGACRTPDLVVNADRTVSGRCNGVTAGDIRDFRLVYYFEIGSTEVDLASVTARLDLRDETRSTVTLEFPANRIVTNFDDDGDLRFNIVEFCEGTNPRVRD